MYMKALALYLLAWVAMNLSEMKADNGAGSIFFPMTTSVHLGYYTVNIRIGKYPSTSFVLDIDTGSDLTWVQCVDGNITYYNPNANVTCGDDACTSLGNLKNDCDCTSLGNLKHDCVSPPCEYSIDYADRGSFDGVLVNDSIPLTYGDGTTTAPNLAFGCGINPTNQNTVGVLGLGKGKPGILHQLSNKSVIRNAFGHCSRGQGIAYLFFGDFPKDGVTWKQQILSDKENYYLGKADILLGGNMTNIRNLDITFDIGSTYSYLASETYGAFLDLVKNHLNGSLNIADKDQTLPVCWKDVRPIETIGQVASYFMNVTLNFKDANNNVQFEILPESYLVISGNQNVCLGILNSAEFGLEDKNLIGDISMQNKLVIYDNEEGKVGWAANTCYKFF